MGSISKIAGWILLAVFIFHLLRIAVASGVFKKINPHAAGVAEVLGGLPGAEDLTIDAETGIAYVSCFDRRRNLAGERVKGALYAVDFQATPPVVTDLTADFAQPDFSPHGLSLYEDPVDGSKWLFVINHRENGHFVEVFQLENGRLVHRESIESPLFLSPNDLVGVGKREFYFTNDHNSKGWKALVKDLLLIGGGQVGFYNGKQVEILDKGIPYANGINVSADGMYLFVASTTGKKIIVYQRNPFRKVSEIYCNTGVDNIELDEKGNLLVGAHPKMFAFLAHAKNPAKRSPSQVLNIEFSEPSAPANITEVYLNDGKPLSGSSVAAAYRDYLLIGTVFEDGILILKGWQ